MKVLNEYPNSHHYWEEYERTELFCPHCGQKSVWQEQSPGDYYCGPDFLCDKCGFCFSMPSGSVSEEPRMLNKVAQLQSGITHEPTTPPA